MSTSGLQQLLHANVLDELQLQDVRMMMEAYPYFPLPYFLLARHYFHTGHPDFQAALLHASARVQNRSFLKDFVESGLPETVAEQPSAQENAIHPPLLAETAASVVKVPVKISSEKVVIEHIVEPIQVLEDMPVSEVEIPQVSETQVQESTTAPIKPTPEAAQPVNRSLHLVLQAKLAIRTGQYLNLPDKIRKQLDAWLELRAEKPDSLTPAPEDVQLLTEAESVQSLPAAEVLPALPPVEQVVQAIVASEVVQPLLLAKAPKVAALPIENPDISAVHSAAFSDAMPLIPYGDDTWSVEQPVVVDEVINPDTTDEGLPLFVIKDSTALDIEADALLQEYEIGQFSAFDFLTSEVPVAEVTLDIHEGKDIAIEVQEDQRILHVSLTKEQLDKYFIRQQPSPVVQSKEPLVTRDERVIGSFEITSLPTASERQSRQRRSKHEYDQMLDQFIQSEPSISRKPVTDVKDNLAKNSVREDQNLVSETLAKIHVKQGNIQKAIRMYERLMLLYPEKVPYFEAEIQKLPPC